MPEIIFFSVLLVLFIGVLIYNQIQKKKVSAMTYDKLLAKCKKCIDNGKYDECKRNLMLHPKLLLIHFNELQIALTDYAREVEESKLKNIEEGDDE